MGPVKPDMYAYHFNVDGMQITDPSNTYAAFTAMPPYSQLIVHGDGPAYYDAKKVPHGNVTRHVYHSEVTQGARELYVYTPPGYDPNDKVDYLFVGQGAEEAKGFFGTRVQALREALVNHQVDHEYYEGGNGGHDWATWRHLLNEKFLPNLWQSK